MKPEEYLKMKKIKFIAHQSDKYLTNEFKTVRIDGIVYFVQGWRYVSDTKLNWCQCGVFNENDIKNIMRNHIQDHYFIDGEKIELKSAN